MYGYPYPTPSPRDHSRPSRRWVAWAYVGGIFLVVIGVATHVLLNRLDSDILTVIATIGCAAGVALPGLILSLVVLLRRENRNSVQYPATTQPTLLVVPPMALPPPQATPTYQGQPPAAHWEAPPRRFTVVGEE